MISWNCARVTLSVIQIERLDDNLYFFVFILHLDSIDQLNAQIITKVLCDQTRYAMGRISVR